MKQELAPRGVGIPVLQGREDVNSAIVGIHAGEDVKRG